MKKDIAEKWVKALRSGKYEQGIACLNRSNKFCCLGVLCDLAVKEGVSIKVTQRKKYMFYNGVKSVLPLMVQEWANMTSPQGVLFNGGALTAMNDKGATFEEIAKIIEKSWKIL